MSGLRDYQREPVDNVERALTLRPGEEYPPDGLRAQLHAACGTGKTFMSAHAGLRVARRGRILVLVPTLDLLSQTIDTWRAAGRGAPMYAVCSMQDHEPAVGVLCTTSSVRLAFWLDRAGAANPVTVFGTYASLPAIVGAHKKGLPVPPAMTWDLVVVDEAHRVSGSASKAWMAVHDNAQLPALRRLYMTATPRVWNIPDMEPVGAGGAGGETEAGGAPGGVSVSSLPRDLAMSMDDTAVFGPVADNSLTVARCQELGILAKYQIVALEIADPVLSGMLDGGGDEAGEARLAAVQVAMLKAIQDESLQKVISFHQRIADAEVFSTTLPYRVDTDDDLRRLFPDGIWSRWLCGEHTPRHRQGVREEFESQRPGGIQRPALLSNVKVIAEGVDSRSDAVAFIDPKGSVVDLNQAVGRALRQKPGEGKLASILVPVVVPRPGTGTVEDAAAGDLVSDPAFAPLMDVLRALRAYDSELIEGLAAPQHRSRTEQPSPWAEDDDLEARAAGDGEGAAAAPRAVLRFAGGRHSAADIAAAVQLRILSPQAQTWLRGHAHARRWAQHYGNLAVPVKAAALSVDGRRSDFPLGRWVADQRSAYQRGDLLPSRIARLEELGMIWSAHEAEWEASLAAAKGWAQANGGHLAAPATAQYNGVRVGRWLSQQRTLAGRAPEDGGLLPSRRKALESVDPWWCPPWPIPWQRQYRTALAHVNNGGTLTDLPDGHLINGEDLGRWAREQHTKWAQLGAPRHELLARIGITPPTQAEAAELARPTTRSHTDRWTTGLTAARAWHAQHGTIANIRRKDTITLDDAGDVRLGVWIMNVRQRAVKLTDQQRAELDTLGMRW